MMLAGLPQFPRAGLLDVLLEPQAVGEAPGQDVRASYRQALGLAEELGMRPMVAHCHFGLGKLYRRVVQV